MNTKYILLCGFIFFHACTPDFDVNAEWEEITVIYGILDASEYYHHVKVSKAFLNTNSDAMLIASSMPDSTYHYDSITVQLYKLDANENIIDTYSLRKIIFNNKDEGLFYYPGQFIYQSDSVVLDQSKNYKIKIISAKTNKITWAVTPIVHPFSIWSYPRDFTIDGFIKFSGTINATIYKVYININYFEDLNGNTTNHTLKWIVKSRLINPGKYPKVLIEGGTFFDFLAASIDSTKDDINLIRTMGQLELVVYAGSEDLEKYINVNNNYSVVTQSKPFFTNINDGVGLFASRYKYSKFVMISQKNIDFIKNNYPGLKFQ